MPPIKQNKYEEDKMSQLIEVKVPDIGDYSDVPVIEIHVKVGDTIAVEDSLVTLESDKATMDVPSSAAGVVKEIKVALGDKISEGSVVVIIEAAGSASAPAPVAAPAAPVASAAPAPAAAAPAPAVAAASIPFLRSASAMVGAVTAPPNFANKVAILCSPPIPPLKDIPMLFCNPF